MSFGGYQSFVAEPVCPEPAEAAGQSWGGQELLPHTAVTELQRISAEGPGQAHGAEESKERWWGTGA